MRAHSNGCAVAPNRLHTAQSDNSSAGGPGLPVAPPGVCGAVPGQPDKLASLASIFLSLLSYQSTAEPSDRPICRCLWSPVSAPALPAWWILATRFDSPSRPEQSSQRQAWPSQKHPFPRGWGCPPSPACPSHLYEDCESAQADTQTPAAAPRATSTVVNWDGRPAGRDHQSDWRAGREVITNGSPKVLQAGHDQVRKEYVTAPISAFRVAIMPWRKPTLNGSAVHSTWRRPLAPCATTESPCTHIRVNFTGNRS